MHPDGLASLCVQLPCIREALLHVTDSDGWLPYHLMAKERIKSFMKYVSQLGDNGTIQILMAQNSKTRETVASIIARQNSWAFNDLVQHHPQCRTSLLAMRDEDGRALHAVGEVPDLRFIFHLNVQGRVGTLNIGRLMSFVRFPKMSDKVIDPQQLQQLLAVSEVPLPAYTTSISTYSETQRSEIMLLLATVHDLISTGPKCVAQIIAHELQCVLSDVRCFPDHFQSLLDICHLSRLQTLQADSVLMLLVRELWRFCTVDLRSCILSHISQSVFRNCPDSMSTHAVNCIVHGLDKLYGLYGGHTVEDIFCPSPNVVCCLVHEIAQEVLTLSNLGPIIKSIFDRATGSNKWSVIRLLIGEDAALSCSEIEDGCFNCDLFSLDRSKGLSLTQKGLQQLVDHFGLFNCPLVTDDAQNKCQIPLSVENQILLQILSTIVQKDGTISAEEWEFCHSFQAQLAKSGDVKFNNFLRMGHSIGDIVYCHTDWTLVQASSTEAHLIEKTTATGAMVLLSFVQPERFKLIFVSEKSISSPVQNFGSLLHFLAEHNTSMLEELALTLEDSVFLSESSASTGELWQHVLARNNPACLLRILGQRDPGLTSKVFHAANTSFLEPVAMVIARKFSQACVLEMVKYPALISAYLAVTDTLGSCKGWCPVHSLAVQHSGHLSELLINVQAETAVEVLSTQHPEQDLTAAHIMAGISPQHFASLIVKLSYRSQLQPAAQARAAVALLSLTDKDGWHPYHYMAYSRKDDKNKFICINWMLKHLTIEDAYSIITAENHVFNISNAWSTSLSNFLFCFTDNQKLRIAESQIDLITILSCVASSVAVRNLSRIACIFGARGLPWFLPRMISHHSKAVVLSKSLASAAALCQNMNASLCLPVFSSLLGLLPMAAVGLSLVNSGHVGGELLITSASLPRWGSAMAWHGIAHLCFAVSITLSQLQPPRSCVHTMCV